MKKLTLIALIICALISLIGVDVAYAEACACPDGYNRHGQACRKCVLFRSNGKACLEWEYTDMVCPEPTPTPIVIPDTTPAPEPTKRSARPLFMMWLLTNGDKMCMIVSETHPSVERQQALCNWVATVAPCADYVYNNNTWSCDAFGGLRLPLHGSGRDLMAVWNSHKARGE